MKKKERQTGRQSDTHTNRQSERQTDRLRLIWMESMDNQILPTSVSQRDRTLGDGQSAEVREKGGSESTCRHFDFQFRPTKVSVQTSLHILTHTFSFCLIVFLLFFSTIFSSRSPLYLINRLPPFPFFPVTSPGSFSPSPSVWR